MIIQTSRKKLIDSENKVIRVTRIKEVIIKLKES